MISCNEVDEGVKVWSMKVLKNIETFVCFGRTFHEGHDKKVETTPFSLTTNLYLNFLVNGSN